MRSANIAIVGGGIAGPILALALAARGFGNVRVFERVQHRDRSGAGINILSSAVRELQGIRLLDDLARQSLQLAELQYLTAQGDLIWSEPRGTAAGYVWPQLSIARDIVSRLAVEQVQHRLGGNAYISGTRITSLDPDDGGGFLLGSSEGKAFHADIVVGADGIRSTMRGFIAPPGEGAIESIPLTIFRGTAWSEPFADNRLMYIAGDGTSKFIVYPMQIDATGSQSLINWACAVPTPEAGAENYGLWNVEVPAQLACEHFQGWSLRGVSPADLIHATPSIACYPMADLRPLSTWFNPSGLVLIGDAAHAMYPVGSNGATQSIIDASALAHHLATSTSVAEALRAFDADRRPSVAAIQAANRQKGPEIVVEIAAQRQSQQTAALETVFPWAEREQIARGYRSLTGAEVDQANTVSPYSESLQT